MWPDAAEAAVRAADLTILGPVDTAAYPPPEEGGVNPSAAVRTRLELYANMRPSRALRGRAGARARHGPAGGAAVNIGEIAKGDGVGDAARARG